MSMIQQQPKDYGDGRTKQSFKDETDINKILVRAQKAGTLSHLQKFQGQYGDFAKFDFSEAQNKIAKANTIFAELPSEVRNEFNQSPTKFFEFVNDPANVGTLNELLPELALPGRQMMSLKPEVAPVVTDAAVITEPPQPAAAPPGAVGGAEVVEVTE